VGGYAVKSLVQPGHGGQECSHQAGDVFAENAGVFDCGAEPALLVEQFPSTGGRNPDAATAAELPDSVVRTTNPRSAGIDESP
jgi:hypothetical protein